MARYRVIAPQGVTFRPNTVLQGLTPAQVASRKHVLKQTNPGRHQVIGETQFKMGEEIGVEGEVSRAMLELLADPVTGEKGSDKVKAKEAARAAAGKNKPK